MLVVWSVRVSRGLFVCVWVWGFKWRLWVIRWTGCSFAWGEIPEQAVICWQMQPNGENIQTTPHQQHPASEQTGWWCSSGRGVKRWQPKRSSEPSAHPNEASQCSPSSVGCSWWRWKIVRCMNHISSLATRSLKFYFTNKSMKNPLTTHLLLALSCRLSLSNSLSLYRVYAVQYPWASLHQPFSHTTSYVSRMQLGFEKEEYLVSYFGAMGTQKGGLPG